MAIQAYHLHIPFLQMPTPLSVRELVIKELIGQPYELKLTVTTPSDINLLAALDQLAVFTVTPVPERRASAAFGQPNAAVEPDRKWAGVIREITRQSTSRDEHTYLIIMAPRIARLQECIDTRLYQNLDLPSVIEAVLRSNCDFKGDDFVIKTTKPYPVLEHITRWKEDGLSFISRLCETCGLTYFFQQAQDKEIIVFIDDQSSYLKPVGVQLYRADAGLESGWNEAVLALAVSAKPVIGSHRYQDYNYRKSMGADLLGAKEVQNKANGLIGHSYLFGEAHHKDPEQGKAAAQLDYEIALAQQIVANGESTVLGFAPGQVFRTDLKDPQAEWGWVLTAVTHQAGRNTSWTNTFTAIPADRIIRLPRKTAKPTISGTIPARVTSPSKYTTAYISETGLYRVAYLFDVDYRNGNWPPAGSSRLMRLAKPYAGDTYGFHMPLIDGTEVQVAFQNGDIDRPYIAYAMHDQSKPDHVTQLNHTRNIIRTPSNNKIRLEDKDSAQHIKISSEYGKSQISLGHLVDASRNKRGEGFELRSDSFGALRANGLMVSAHVQDKAHGKVLDMQPAVTGLQDAQKLMQGLAKVADMAKADSADTAAMTQLLQSQIDALKQAVILLSAPAAIAAVTPSSIQHSAGKNLTFTAGDNADIGVLKKFTVIAGETISLLAHKMGLKLFANEGKLQIQAQNDAMELAAQKDLSLTSSQGHITLQARKSITLTDGGGAYIKLENGNITIAAPSNVTIKMANFQWAGPDSNNATLPDFSSCHGSLAGSAADGQNSVALPE
ncbi:type VI secretion system Vgr family protein [Amantichitinum ursilacus]|uniref:Phage-related baseplate assembly protein n=1 Tax=Amantichitinum ursilacus TaxID=857265 RepID=A0A0N1JTC2_9NEIS|nr:type VI secretion system Vgr family protein [Amantichitinum ursilacus]KPC54138.1 Phage-related baseplate assembly protein [Amantichitinum ursilacus]